MTTHQPTSFELQVFRKAIEASLGFLVEPEQTPRLASLFQSRTRALGTSSEDYVHHCLSNPNEVQHLVENLTVGETYFFRHMEQLQAYAQTALPDRSRSRLHQPVRIASVGCSSGEEPYSLAILAQMSGYCGSRVSISGLDINLSSLQKARLGNYSPWSLRVTTPQMRAQWFHRHGKSLAIAASVRNSVRFLEANLVDRNSHQWTNARYDIIFCRNVLMYFSPSQWNTALEHLHTCLTPGGFLFLGHAENLRTPWTEKFELKNSHGCFYYQKPEIQVQAPPPLFREQTASVTTASLGRVLDRASRRPRRDDSESHLASSRAEQLLMEERYEEAFALLDSAKDVEAAFPTRKLLKSIALLQLGRFEDADTICRSSLHQDGPSAGLHFLRGLCWEGRQNISSALLEHRRAANLDTTFAMPRVHLALLARRNGDQTMARREFEVARQLLHHETSERLRLYSPGFGREALLELCRSHTEAMSDDRGRTW